ncbi:hypothetical protein M422DRAFT_277177 [Sphaerobolus stellatus SS14]|uniref:Unplaced genomic scaffold SPHSTscaffold_1214, whole genome shotgun sequence n=1 Tax=Sphaerobolus stellatus (strain SS14) TaxID=990650 RepID=A0A0C9T123_SPHS4|nr:hypothetical protein M422DRAFT_277177 [Sphaerobolus stellatus SS14]
MPDSKESQAKRSSNAADLLSRFREKQARHDENHVEVGAVYGACFVYHPEGCSRCSKYLEHLLEDISERPARFSFARDEILDGIHDAWPHITEYIRDLDVSRSTLEKELDIEKTDNRHLRSELNTLDERIQELEARLESLQPKPTTGDQSITAASTTDISSSDVGPHPLSSPGDRTYSHKRSRKLFENPSFQNRVMVPEKRPDYWSLYMWNAVKEWHTNPMSVPNALRDDNEGYFLEEDIDVAAWIAKVSADIPRSTFMEQMKVVFGSHDSFDMAFSGFDKNLLGADHQATMWITDSATPLRLSNHIVKDFLALVLEHCVLTRTQIYGRIIPYMIRHEAKRPCSRTGSERAAYMHLALRPPAPHKGKRPVTGSLQSRLSMHALTPVQTGESSRQRLDADLDKYNQVHEPVLPYEEEPPRGEPEVGDMVPPSVGADKTLPDESHMDVDPELDDIYS